MMGINSLGLVIRTFLLNGGSIRLDMQQARKVQISGPQVTDIELEYQLWIALLQSHLPWLTQKQV